MPCKKKKYNSRFPPARIKKIMQSDDEVGKVAAVVPVIISRVLEIFVENLLKDSCKITKQRNARTLTPSHIKATILQNSQLDFLKEIVSLIPDIQGGLNEDDQIDYNQLNNQQLNDFANFYPNNSSANSSHHKLIKQLSHPATSPNQQLNNGPSTITDQLPQQQFIMPQSQATSSFPLNSNKNFKNYSRSNSAPPSTTTINEFNEQKRSKLKKQEDDIEEDDYEIEEEDESLSDNDEEEVFSTKATIANQPIKQDVNSFKVSKKELVEDDDYDT